MENTNVLDSQKLFTANSGDFLIQKSSQAVACALFISPLFAPGFLSGATLKPRAAAKISKTSTQHNASLITAASPSEQIQILREDFGFSVTTIAEKIFKVSRPTIYTWRRDNSVPPAVRAKLKSLVTAAAHWKEKCGKQSRDYILDYSGLDGDGETILEAMSSASPSAEALIALIDTRLHEAEEGEAYARKLLGDQKEELPEVTDEERERNVTWNSLNRGFSWNR